MSKPRHFRIALLLMITLPLCAWSQKSSFRKIEVTWQVMHPGSEEHADTRAVFTITNHGNRLFYQEGWSLYFNTSASVHTSDTKGNLAIERINGDLYRIMPRSGVAPVSKGESVRVECSMKASALNVSNAPGGMYWVWDAKPDTGIPVRNFAVLQGRQAGEPHPENDERFVSRSERIFMQNERTRELGEDGIVKIFPTPFAYEERSGLFMITEFTWIETDPDFEEVAEYLAEEIYFTIGKKPAINPDDGDDRNKITLTKSNTKPEAYTLSVNPARIEITSSTPVGAFYGVQSLKTLITPSTLKTIQRFTAIPSVEVMDGPRFTHRGLLLDVARNFHSKSQVMKIIDLMALYKLNVLHLHLNDDEGWRLEIPGLPELTEIGGRRGHNLDGHRFLQPAYGSGPGWSSSPGNGYFSRQDFIDILQYAKLHFVTVIPEIATPSHARAAIVSMNYRYNRLINEGNKREAEEFLLRDPEDESVYTSAQGWTDNVMDPGLPSTYRFIEKVVDELIAMYEDAGVSLTAIHMGGSEIPENVWTASPAAALLVKGDSDIGSSRDLRRYFFHRVERILHARGLPLYGWHDIATRDRAGGNVFPDPAFAHQDVLVDVRSSTFQGSETLAARMARAGYKVVLSYAQEFNFNRPYDQAFDEPGYPGGEATDIDKIFAFRPFAEDDDAGVKSGIGFAAVTSGREQALPAADRQKIMGIKGLLWSETLTSSDELEYMLLPRLLALAERAWSRDKPWEGVMDRRTGEELFLSDWSHFVNVLGRRELPRLDFYHGGYTYRIPAPGLKADRGMIHANIQLPGLILRYSVDGREPTARSPVYTAPVPATGIVKVRAFNATGRGGKTSTWTNPLSLPEYGPEDQDESDSAYTHK